MGFHDYISEGEAASLAGVSANTLRRFAEAGYLHAESDHDGIQLFSRGEVQSLFQIPGYQSFSESTQPRPSDTTPTSLQQAIEVTVQREDGHANTAASEAVLRWDDELPPPEEATPSKSEGLVEQPPVEAAPVKAPHTESPPASFQPTQSLELQRLQHLVSLHEKLLDLKDQQIADLSKERDWLRTRIEKLEDKHDRDQLILLSETQMLRKVLVMNEKKKSPWRAALEWFGVTGEQPRSESSFEVGRSDGGTFEVPRPNDHTK